MTTRKTRTTTMPRRIPAPRAKARTAYDLLDAVCGVILAEPKRYDQANWLKVRTTRATQQIRRTYRDPFGAHRDGAVKRIPYPKCGTVGCVAGWCVALVRPMGVTPLKLNRAMRNYADDVPYFSISDVAAQLLGLDYESKDILFAGEAVVGTPGTVAYAKAGVAHIRAFMQNHEVTLRAHQVQWPASLGL